MGKNQRYQIILALTACIVAGLLFHFGTPKPADSDFNGSVPTLEESDLNFKKSLLFTSDSFIIDDGEVHPLVCGVDPQVFGYIPLDKEVTAELSCSEDYLGGVKLRYKASSSAEFNTIELGQRDADAGDLWDIRSLLTRAADGRLIIETMVLSSSENEKDDKQPASCSIRQESVIWDPPGKTFVNHSNPGEFFLGRFTAPVNVVNDCLDNQGNWRGQSK